MKAPLLAGLLVVTGLVWGQDPLKGLPKCAVSCVNSAIISTGCQALDVRCFCTANSFHQTIAPCIADACEEKDQEQTEQYARGVCSIVGVDLPSFQELLSTAEVGSTARASSISPVPTWTNQTSSSFNATTTTLPSLTALASVTGSAALAGEKSSAQGLEVGVVVACLFAVGIGLGILLT